ncbi:hypothetical protein [uncultured Algibacter sp.]|uniref:hypothetical protein n=1 Tax=uncultured Algibacter sp. TaxID=298659 RepID=UPI0030ECFB1B|tara:strand:- start:979 stop:1251 length:273 start_codon:yes stop_codon:yes gene_type:complete
MITVIVQHEVRDFLEWKKVFDADLPKLEKAEVKLMSLGTSTKNRNDVTMIFEAPSIEIFNSTLSDPQRQHDIEKAGVTSELKVSTLNKIC